MKVGIGGELEREPARFVLVECGDARIFIEQRFEPAAQRVESEGDSIRPEDTFRSGKQSEDCLPAVESREAKERPLRDLRPIVQFGGERGRPSLHLVGDGLELLANGSLHCHGPISS